MVVVSEYYGDCLEDFLESKKFTRYIEHMLCTCCAHGIHSVLGSFYTAPFISAPPHCPKSPVRFFRDWLTFMRMGSYIAT